MSIDRLFLGIDTSCYTTSLAVADGEHMISLKKPLEVKAGECGLRQSEAFFQHSRNLPALFEKITEEADFSKAKELVITVSSRPRNIDGSYMPVFTAGYGYARAIAAVTGARLLEASHQEGHIMAAIYSCKKYSIMDEPFLTYHISGGTTELLLCEKEGTEFNCRIVGGTSDLPAGQFIDRIGVKAGFSFPCGKYVDYAACNYSGERPKVKTSVKGAYINLSGEETRYSRILADDKNGDFAAYCTMKCISESIKKSVMYAKDEYKISNVLMVGGVSSSKFMREEFSDIPGVYFAEPELCTDNAVGTCLMGKLKTEQLL